MKKWIALIIVLAGGTGGMIYWRGLPAGLKGRNGEGLTKTAVAEKQDIRFAVSVAGEIGPAEQVSVRPEINGRISELPVDVGDKIKKDSLLFALDDKDLQIEIQTRATEIESAQLQLDKALRNYERDKKLFEANLVSKEVYENSRTEYELAKNTIERTNKTLDLTKDRLSKTRVKAPFDCTILTRPISVGQAVSGSGGFNSGTEVLTIADLNEMIINAHVNQADVTRLKVKMEVDVQVEAVTGLKVKGIIDRIAPQATIKNNIKGFAVRITLKNIDPRVQPGMTANVSIPVESADNVLTVPLAAVFTEFNQDSGEKDQYVYVQKAVKFERRPVKVGVSDYFHAEVLSGLKEGEVVALELPPPADLLEGPKEPDKGKGKEPARGVGSKMTGTARKPGST